METLKNFLALVTTFKLGISSYKYIKMKFPEFGTKKWINNKFYHSNTLKIIKWLFMGFSIVLLFHNVLIYTFIFLRSNLSIEGFVTGFLVFCLLTIYPILFLLSEYNNHKRETLFRNHFYLN